MEWQSLGAPSAELTLDFTLPTGQSFRWRRTGTAEFTGVVDNRVVSCAVWCRCAQPMLAVSAALPLLLSMVPCLILQVKVQQLSGDVQYQVIARGKAADSSEDAAVLRDYFNLQTCLKDLCQEWCRRDERYRMIHAYFPGKHLQPSQERSPSLL